MPGRVASTRTARKTTSAKSLRSARNSSPVAEVPDEGKDTSLRRAVCGVFADAQKSTAAHRKAVITLRKIQEACCYEQTSSKKSRQSEEFEEEDFNREVVRIVLRILPVRKAEPVGDRVIRFLGTFLATATAKDIEIFQQNGDVEDDALPETPTSRLNTQILTELLRVLQAKDKTIRFRATQITSHIVNSVDTLDDILFHKLRFALLKRIHDKEAPVRLQAVYGLGRLAAEVGGDGDEDSDSDDDMRGGVLNKLLQVLQNDPSSEVRRNLLLNLPLTKEVLPYLLERARDADATTRRSLYGRLLPALGDFRHLSMTHREKLLRWGLRDRDENVRKATAQLFSQRWIEDCAALPAAQVEEGDTEKQKEAVPSLDALLELLERIDVVNSGREGGIALVGMHEFWRGRPDYLDYVSFPDDFWEDLSPELAFVARTFNDFCRSATREDYVGPKSLEVLVDEKLPEVTKFGFLLQREIIKLIEATEVAAKGGDDDEDAQTEMDYREFVVEQMLHMALTFDYSDEVGRQKMFDLTRRSLGQPDLPEEVTRLLTEVLRLVCGENAKGEREFCGVVLEAIAEVHDTIMGDDDVPDDASSTEGSFHSATSQFDGEVDDDTTVVAQRMPKKKKQKAAETNPEAEAEKAVKEIMVNMKCLHIAMCMLQNVQCDLEENAHLVTMLNNLVVPAVRSQEAPLRERGLMCLGLCCLLGKNLAQENLALFLHCFARGHPDLQAISLQIVTDILVTHPTLLTDQAPSGTDDQSATENEYIRPVIKAFKNSLKSNELNVQSTGATALSKAMLSRLVTDSDLLKQLVVTYFDPDSQQNAQLQQTLTYFFPVYCHSRAENAMRMVEVVCPVLQKLGSLRELDDADVEDDSAEGMVKMSKIGEMLTDWTDPRRIVGFAESVESMDKASGANDLHYVLAENILERLVTAAKIEKEEKKVLFSMLNKVHLPAAGASEERVRTILELCAEAVETKAHSTATDKNVLTKMQNGLLKIMHDFATEERGGGGAEETVLDTTTQTISGQDVDEESVHEGDGDTTVIKGSAVDHEDDMDESISQLQAELRDATLGATTTGFVPDAEGTRIGLGMEDDTEMMDVDD